MSNSGSETGTPGSSTASDSGSDTTEKTGTSSVTDTFSRASSTTESDVEEWLAGLPPGDAGALLSALSLSSTASGDSSGLEVREFTDSEGNSVPTWALAKPEPGRYTFSDPMGRDWTVDIANSSADDGTRVFVANIGSGFVPTSIPQGSSIVPSDMRPHWDIPERSTSVADSNSSVAPTKAFDIENHTLPLTGDSDHIRRSEMSLDKKRDVYKWIKSDPELKKKFGM